MTEGRRRWHFKDNQRFIRIARGSLYETTSFLRLVYIAEKEWVRTPVQY
ncbi:four helix bundle protein [Roseofilum reptotaenium CS-1145]|nr:four helix bundle protein [Roseofilum reptotaenium CS-1145]